MPKIRQSVSIQKDLYEWIQTQIKEQRFKDTTHAVNLALYRLREETEKKQET